MKCRAAKAVWGGVLLLAAGLASPNSGRSELVKRPIYVNSEGKTVYQYVFQSTRSRYARRPYYQNYSPYYRVHGGGFSGIHRHPHHGGPKPPGQEPKGKY